MFGSKHIVRLIALLLISGFALFGQGCAVNPVTGKKEMVLISQSMEIEMGTKNYMPARQIQGGDYVADPGVVEYVKQVGRRIAAVADRKLPYEFVVVNDSTPNAWAMPGGKIAVHRGLLTELHDEAELAAVLSHEVVHAAARHSAKQMERALFLQGALLVTAVLVDSSGKSDDWAGIFAVGGAQVAAFLLTQKFSRDAEREADHYGMIYMARAGYDPAAAVRLQETFLRLSKGRDSGWLRGLLSTHPPSKERIEANKKTLATLPKGGEVGKERYQKAMARLFRVKPAYAAYDKGKAALKKKRPRKALGLADKAISIEPEEALFYILKGDALLMLGNKEQALESYAVAEGLNPNYYYSHQQRGLVLLSMRRVDEAEQALKESVRLLPTAPALNALGRIALAKGKKEEAKRYFKAAAQSDSPVGKEAWRELLKIDLPHNAKEYITVKPLVSKSGELLLKIKNETPLELGYIRLSIYTPGGYFTLYIDDTIAGRKSKTFRTGRLVIPPKRIKDYSIAVEEAKLVER